MTETTHGEHLGLSKTNGFLVLTQRSGCCRANGGCYTQVFLHRQHASKNTHLPSVSGNYREHQATAQHNRPARLKELRTRIQMSAIQLLKSQANKITPSVPLFLSQHVQLSRTRVAFEHDTCGVNHNEQQHNTLSGRRGKISAK